MVPEIDVVSVMLNGSTRLMHTHISVAFVFIFGEKIVSGIGLIIDAWHPLHSSAHVSRRNVWRPLN